MIRIERSSRFKIKIPSEQDGYTIQEKLFSLGCYWSFDSSRLRKLRGVFGVGISENRSLYLIPFEAGYNEVNDKEIRLSDLE